MPTPSQRTALLVLGMHRSGTSLLTRILSLLGADLPSNLAPPNPGNEAGYWESLTLNALHEEIFNALSLSWDSLAPIPDRWFTTSHAAAHQQKIANFLQTEFPTSPLFVLKDPRMSRLLPLWTKPLADANIRPICLLTLRNPLEVAASLERLYPILPQHAHLLWLRYTLDAERHSRSLPRCVISYDDLLSDWPAPITRLAELTGLQFPRPLTDAAPQIQSALAPRIRHFRITPALLEADPSIIWWVKSLYAAHQTAARTPASADLPTLSDQLHKLATDAHLAYGPLLTHLPSHPHS